jgi:O-antigen/teichoic acid export membrane protein
VGLLFRGFDVAFPNIVTAEAGLPQERLAGDVTRIASYVGGVGLGWLVADREPIARLLFGRPSHSGAEVLALFAMVWLVNIPAHGLSLLLVARDCQRVFVGLTIFEAIVDVSLTIVLAMRFGAPGAAWASLISIGGSNVILLPILARRCTPWTVKRGLVLDGYLPLLGGVLLALGVTLLLPRAVGPIGDAGVVGLAGLLAGVVVVGRRGRALLRQSLKRT